MSISSSNVTPEIDDYVQVLPGWSTVGKLPTCQVITFSTPQILLNISGFTNASSSTDTTGPSLVTNADFSKDPVCAEKED